jgi:hypothetical protein
MPRSDVTTRTATSFVSSRPVISGWSRSACDATADTARMRARVYGSASRAVSRALLIREAAMSSIARKTFLSVCVARIFCL